MIAKLCRHLTYANVVSTLCLLILLGGTATAARLITGRQIKDSSLTTRDVKDKSLLGRDFRPGQLPSGPQGPKGDKGDDGAPATKLFAHVTLDGTLGASNQGATAATRTSRGEYQVTFQRDLAGCVAFAQIGQVPNTVGLVPLDGIADTTIFGSQVGVSLRSSRNIEAEDGNFNLAVFC